MRDDRETFQPLGPARDKPAPAPQPEWKPTGTPGIERAPDGKLRNVQPTPPEPPPPFPYFGCPRTWGTVIDNLRRECGG